MKNLFIGLLAFAAFFPALSQDKVFLTKSETEALAKGKVWNMVRVSDSNKIRLDFRADGGLYGNNYTYNATDSGTWAINDAGQICLTWRGRSQNACNAILKNSVADKRQMFDATSLDVLKAEFTVE